jgi:hypothetical protein
MIEIGRERGGGRKRKSGTKVEGERRGKSKKRERYGDTSRQLEGQRERGGAEAVN